MSEIIKRKHPGSIIKKSLDAWNMSSKEFSIRSGISERTLSDIINEKGSITFDVAQKLALYFNNSIEVWLNLQTQYNVYMNHEQLIQAFKEDYQCIKPTLSYLKSINVIADEDIDEQTIVLKTRIALNINRLTTLKQPNSFVSLKELNSNSKDNEVQKNLWISYCLTLARKQTVKEFNKKTLLSYIPEIRSMTKQNPSIFYPRLKEILNESGVCFILLPYLNKSNIFGATKWLNSSTVMLAISNRGNRLDSFWFTFFHELAHVTFEHKRYMLINYEGKDDNEADNLAKELLINSKDWQSFIEKNRFDLDNIKDFASSINIHPLIVLGRLEKEKLISYGKYEKQLNSSYLFDYCFILTK